MSQCTGWEGNKKKPKLLVGQENVSEKKRRSSLLKCHGEMRHHLASTKKSSGEDGLFGGFVAKVIMGKNS